MFMTFKLELKIIMENKFLTITCYLFFFVTTTTDVLTG